MRTSLRTGKKWGFVEGTVAMLKEDSPEIEEWWTVQSMLVSWVLNTVEPTLQSTISYRENVQDLREDIKDRFSVMNGPRIQQLKSDLAGHMHGRMMVVAYYGKLKTVCEELWAKISGCKCNIAFKWKKHKEEEKVHQFLMRKLDDRTYEAIGSSLL